MNHIHRLVWNSASNTWVAVAENARGRGKSSSRKLVAAALSLVFTCAQAGPLGGVVASGAGTITQAGSATTIVQTTPNLSLNWKSFNVGAAESVKFVQPSANSVAVNRIFDTNGSQILGRLSANGQVYLINPNGILFGKGAQVNVGGLVASTLGFNDASLGANARVFSGSSLGSVVNLGSITTAEGGFVALLGNTVSNQGTITAPRGKVMLGGASAATLNFANNALVSMKIDQSVFNTLVENGGLIKADGGSVALTAGTETSKAPGVVRQTGYIQARTLDNQNGIITLLSGMATGTVYVDGTLDASAPLGGNGGFIETSAAKVRIGNDVKVSTAATKGLSGKWLIDPTDFTISAIDPGNGDGFMSSAVLTNSLKAGDVAIQTSNVGSGNGDINVNDTVSWAANKLTLNAAGNININAPLKGSGTASLAFEYGQGAGPAGNTSTYVINAAVDLPTGLNFSTVMGLGGALKTYTVINDLGKASDATIATMPQITTLQAMAAAPNLTRNFVLGSNIDASDTAKLAYNAAAGFIPIGNTTYGRFAGVFDGLGHSISTLTVGGGGVETGLFGSTGAGSLIQNIALLGGSVTGAADAGGLVGNSNGTINKSSNTGTVTGAVGTGGLVGSSDVGSINNSFTTGAVIGTVGTGGLVGNTFGSINNSYTTGTVTGNALTGGLAGSVGGNITSSYATGAIKGDAKTGGLVGAIIGDVKDSYNRGAVKGASPVGGLVGYGLSGNVTRSFNTGAVVGDAATGGLVGSNGAGTVNDSYNTGTVNGAAQTGGILGNGGTGKIIKSFNTGNVSGFASTGGLAGLSTSLSVFDSYNTGNIEGAAAVGGLIGTSTGSITNSYASGTVKGDGPGGLAGTISGAVTNSYWDNLVGPAATMGGGTGLSTTALHLRSSFPTWDFSTLWSINEGVTSPGLTSLLNSVTVTANNASRVYDGTGYLGGNGVVYSNMPFGFVPGKVSYVGDAQNAVNVKAGGYAITPQVSFSNQQYVVTYVSGNLSITPAPLTIGAPTVSRDYDGTRNVSANLFMLLGLVKGENLGFTTGVGTMLDKNVGADKPVTFGAISLSDGSGVGMGLASNYSVTAGAPKATISRLASVTYTGNGSSSNWFDPANWGGAVPDLSNVANVVIPKGFNVSFNNASPTAPAEAGPVNVDSVTSAGALNLYAGTLNVATSMTLPALSQSGGSLSGTGSLTVGQSFTQTGGTIKMGGDVALTQATAANLVIKSLAGNTVTLKANNSITLGDLSAAGKLTLEYGQSTSLGGNNDYVVNAPVNLNAGLNFSTKLGFDGVVQNYQVITRLGDVVDVTLPPMLTTLQGVANAANLGGKYVLGSNIDAAFTADAAYNGTAGFIPIGDTTQRFTGVFDGLGHTVSGLMINLPAIADVGLFGFAMGNTVIQNVGLVGGSILGGAGTGGLVGNNDNGSIRNSFNTGTVTGGAGTGGLVGNSATGNISNSYATGLVIGAAGTGGLLGTTATGNVSNSYATGAVAGAAGTGGLVGTIATGAISNSYAKGDVAGGAGTGGLVGTSTGPVTLSYASGNVTGTVAGVPGAGGAFGVGGLVGASTGNVSISYATGNVSGGVGVGGLLGTTTGVISNTFASGNVSANSNAGGLMGDSTSPVSNSYATGKVTGAAATTGALMGTSTVTISNNFYDNTVNPSLPGVGAPSIPGGSTGLTTAEMLVQNNFTKATAANGQVAPAWDFDKVWTMAGGTKPLLMAFSIALVPTVAPTAAPTSAPTVSPTAAPTAAPTMAPTPSPTAAPTSAPTAAPTAAPTSAPTASPTAAPTAAPTVAPTMAPTPSPTAAPTSAPTAAPTSVPTASPTAAPTSVPTASPTAAPTVAPTMVPNQPNAFPAVAPRAELKIAIANTVGKLQSDASLQKIVISPGSSMKIIETRISSEDALKAAAQVLSSNEIQLQIIDEGMQLTQTLFIPNEDDEEERRRKRALITR